MYLRAREVNVVSEANSWPCRTAERSDAFGFHDETVQHLPKRGSALVWRLIIFNRLNETIAMLRRLRGPNQPLTRQG